MKKTFYLILFLFLFQNGFSCLNGYQVIPGIEKFDEEEYRLNIPEVYTPSLQNYVNKTLIEIKSGYKKEHVDLVIGLLYLHNNSKALEISGQLLKKFPNEYNVVITHAATLELNGKLNEALVYIKKAIELNPDSHKKSEWIHVKIIEDLMGLNKNEYSVIGLDFGTGKEPVLEKLTKEEKYNLLVQTAFQISEREYFIPGNDPAFGKLMFDYANLLYVNDYISISEIYFQRALDYGFINDLSEQRLKYVMEWVEKKYKSKNKEEEIPKKKEKSKKEESGISWKSILSNSIPFALILGLWFLIWYRNKMYYDKNKK